MRGALYLFRFRAYPSPPLRPTPSSLVALSTPIRHVVVIDEENHSFDNMLGVLWIQDSRCDGASSGTLLDGTTIQLATATDVVPIVDHSVLAQVLGIDGGKMDGFERIAGCEASTGYAC